jgi:hypothetical protein
LTVGGVAFCYVVDEAPEADRTVSFGEKLTARRERPRRKRWVGKVGSTLLPSDAEGGSASGE